VRAAAHGAARDERDTGDQNRAPHEFVTTT
jgi:hypothetical protein